MNAAREPAVWFPTVRTGTGTDVFTERLVAGLRQRGIRAEITWLPLRAEYAPWTVHVPEPPAWATIAHVNTWLHPRFLPKHLPIVATIHHSVHDPDAKAYKGFARAAYHRWWIAPNERRVLRRADRVVAVSHFVAEATKRTLLDVPIQVIHNGVDTDKFRPGNRQRRSGEPFRLLYVGSWMARKGVDLLAPIMRELGEGFELRYTGGAVAERHKQEMPANMHDIGRLESDEAVIAAMQDSDALLFPSRSEGFGLVAAEAMACGLPVIATRGSSLTEVVEDGSTGLLVDRDATRKFAAAARALADKPAMRDALSRQATAQAFSRFSRARMLDDYCRIYQLQVPGIYSPSFDDL
jgi:glycosyltransferase involved in cell wall biosynthesis